LGGYLPGVARQLSWRQLVPGVVAAVLAVTATVGVLAFGRVGELHGAKVRLYVATDAARGVIQGTDVWFDGVKIGTVRDTKLRPYTVDTARRVLVELDVRRRDAFRIRRDSRAQIRPGSSQLGLPVVFFSGGTPSSPAVRPGDTLISDPQSAFDVTRAKFADFEQQIPEIRADLDTLKTQIFSSSGPFSPATRASDIATARELKILSRGVARRRAKAVGTLALVGRGDLVRLAAHALASADSLVALVQGDYGLRARMREDTAFEHSVASTRSELATVRTLLASPQGTIGRVPADSAIRRAVDDADASMRALESDASRNPHRYLPF
jgi:hypothetical protein